MSDDLSVCPNCKSGIAYLAVQDGLFVYVCGNCRTVLNRECSD